MTVTLDLHEEFVILEDVRKWIAYINEGYD